MAGEGAGGLPEASVPQARRRGGRWAGRGWASLSYGVLSASSLGVFFARRTTTVPIPQHSSPAPVTSSLALFCRRRWTWRAAPTSSTCVCLFVRTYDDDDERSHPTHPAIPLTPLRLGHSNKSLENTGVDFSHLRCPPRAGRAPERLSQRCPCPTGHPRAGAGLAGRCGGGRGRSGWKKSSVGEWTGRQ